jgi:GNAT superfamily N-acetyltransferase
MTEADIDATGYIRKAALEWLARGSNREPRAWMPNRSPHFAHLLKTDPRGAIVAETRGTVVGFAMGFVRGDIWFLSQLFVQPEVHALGGGRELLRQAIAYGRERGARVFSVVASSSPVAHALYMRAGMFATAVGYQVSGPVEGLLSLPKADGSRKTVVDCSGWLDRIDALDTQVWGASRRMDHELYLDWPDPGDEEQESFALTRDGEFAGYAYCTEEGHIGPVAAYHAADQLALLRIAGEWMREREAGEPRAFVTSANGTVLAALLEAGWKVRSWTYFKTSEAFGQFDRYVPSGGLLL